MIKNKEFFTYKYGCTYAHERGNYIFSADWHWNRFMFGAEWWFFNCKFQELYIGLGFIELNWTRILP